MPPMMISGQNTKYLDSTTSKNSGQCTSPSATGSIHIRQSSTRRIWKWWDRFESGRGIGNGPYRVASACQPFLDILENLNNLPQYEPYFVYDSCYKFMHFPRQHPTKTPKCTYRNSFSRFFLQGLSLGWSTMTTAFLSFYCPSLILDWDFIALSYIF